MENTSSDGRILRTSYPLPVGLHDDWQVFAVYGDKNHMRDSERIKTRN
jgi:hypothetical protein